MDIKVDKEVVIKEIVVTLSERELAIIEDAVNFADDNFYDISFMKFDEHDVTRPELNAVWLQFYQARKEIEA